MLWDYVFDFHLTRFLFQAAVVSSLSGLILDINEPVEALLGHERNELIGEPVTCLFPDNLKRFFFFLFVTKQSKEAIRKETKI